jgi:hypothetical protein
MGNEPESDKQDEELQANEGGESDQSSSDQSGDQASEQEGQSGAQHADAEQSSEADELAKVKDQLLRTGCRDGKRPPSFSA